MRKLVQYLAEELPETLPGLAREVMGVTAEGTHFDTVLEGRRARAVGDALIITYDRAE